MVASADPTISYNIINGNSAGEGGGIFIESGYPFTVGYNIICDNMATNGNGGGIFSLSSLPVILNNTIYGNYSTEMGGGYSGVGGSPATINTIIYGNTAGIEGNGIQFIGSPIITYCDIQDTLWPGEGNISCDPQFCNSDSGIFYLDGNSCCLAAGENGANIGAGGIGCWTPCTDYCVGDVNLSGNYDGLDITYGVNYLKGGAAPKFICICTPGNIWYASGDVNGSCSYNGLDITYGVSYLKGIQTELIPCPDCPPVRAPSPANFIANNLAKKRHS
jgi:hypothetical protein